MKRLMAIWLFALLGGVTSSAQQRCCCQSADGSTVFQINQSGQCSIACKSNLNATSVAVGKCNNFGAPPKGSVSVPNRPCDSYWNEIPPGGCQGNHWIECGLGIQQLTMAFAGVPVQVQFTSQNLGQETGTTAIALRHRIWVKGSVDWGDKSEKPPLDTGQHTLTHVYTEPNEYKVSAEIEGDFKWNEMGVGNSSCSYHARTEPSSVVVYVLPRVASTIDTSAFQLRGMKKEGNIIRANFEPTGKEIVSFDVNCGSGNRFRVNGGSNRSACVMEFKEAASDWKIHRVECSYRPNAASVDAVKLDCEKVPNACVQSLGSASCKKVVAQGK